MQASRKLSVWLLIIVAVSIASESPVSAYYGHRNHRRSGRGYNQSSSRMAGVQRASASLNSAQARLYAAKTNATRQIRQARQQALNSPALMSAKSENITANQDYQTARTAVIARLKDTNPEFRDLLVQCQAKRAQIVALAKSGESSGEIQGLESQLKTMVRKVSLIEEPVVNADPTVKEIVSRKGSIHAKAQSAEKDALNAAAKDPAVQAAQKQLAQAQQQAQQATSRYNSALASASNAGMYGGRPQYRRSGYGGYRGFGNSGRSYYHPVYHVHHVRPRATSFHTVRRHR